MSDTDAPIGPIWPVTSTPPPRPTLPADTGGAPASRDALRAHAADLRRQAVDLGVNPPLHVRRQQEAISERALAVDEQADAMPPEPPPPREPGEGFPIINWHLPDMSDEARIETIRDMQEGAAKHGLDPLGEDGPAIQALQSALRSRCTMAEGEAVLSRHLGEQKAATVAAARAAVARFGENFAALLETTGAGNDPLLVIHLADLARRKGWAQ